MVHRLICIVILAFSIPACRSTQYPYQTYRYSYEKEFINGYLLPGNGIRRNELVIYVDGSGLYSAVGTYRLKNDVTYETFAYSLRKYAGEDVDVYVPDKINFEPGQAYRPDNKTMEFYTFTDRVHSAVIAIDSFLSEHHYGRISLVGYSEGAIIVPRIYHLLHNRQSVTNLVLVSHGGFSQYECFKLLRDSPLSFGYKQALSELDEQCRRIKENPNDRNQYYLGWPYTRWSGFMDYRPMEDLLSVTIPIFLLHGSQDTSAPVESSEYIVQQFTHLNKTNAVLKRYDGYDHLYNNDFKFLAVEIGNCIH